MKRFFCTTLLFTFILAVFAQGNPGFNPKFNPEEFNARMQQFISREAGLTPQQAAKFFPLYNEMLKKQRVLFIELNRLKRVKPVGNKACMENIKRCDEIEVQMKELQQSYHTKFMKVLPAEKVYDVINAVDKFHRHMFRNARRR